MSTSPGRVAASASSGGQTTSSGCPSEAVRRAPWTPRDVPSWSVRWVWLPLVTELARYAGHADIIREQLDGRLSWEPLASWEGDRA